MNIGLFKVVMVNNQCQFMYCWYRILVGLITFVVLDNAVKDILKTFMGIFVIRAAVDQLLLAEGTSLACTWALVGAVADQVSLLASVNSRAIDQSVVTEEDWALGIISSWVLQAEGQASVITPLVVPPILGGQLDAFGNGTSMNHRRSNAAWGRVLADNDSSK